ncbi:MAG: TlyA family RNA methyltransferase [Corynebacterium sp.]|nr:TlyA family RNA methyltransferase [Corynebacterium sp.]
MAKPKLRRLDAELVRRKIVRSRTQAQEHIKEGHVYVGGMKITKPASQVDGDVSIRLDVDPEDDWASRGAHKLLGVVEAFDIDFTGLRVMDAGASTGGFTDVCLREGAAEVCAIDVGYGLLAWRLQQDPRVIVHDRTNIRTITPETIGMCDAMVGDLSFISLELTLPPIVACLKEGAFLLPMVKPQFEVGKERLGSGGVVRSPELRAEVTTRIATFAQSLGLSLVAVAASPLPGPSGNVEYFLHLVKDGGAEAKTDSEISAMVEKAVAEGPQ